MKDQSAREFVLAQAAVASALIEMEAMKVANLERERQGHAPAYGEDEALAKACGAVAKEGA